MMRRSANFSIVRSTPNMLLLRDDGPWDRYPTITNDAEHVVEVLAPSLHGKHIIYYDSDGDLTELRTYNGKFTGFGAVDRSFINSEMGQPSPETNA